ncbi:MAG TPA: hypothetical protein VL966_07290 [Alphaproteobacteria bacterium]|nr:hypothetical protein [Alphaproteobacteria bacterium]
MAGFDEVGLDGADAAAAAFAGAFDFWTGAESAVVERSAIAPAVAMTAVNQPVDFLTSCRWVGLGRRSFASIPAFLTEPLAERQAINVKSRPTRTLFFGAQPSL